MYEILKNRLHKSWTGNNFRVMDTKNEAKNGTCRSIEKISRVQTDIRSKSPSFARPSPGVRHENSHDTRQWDTLPCNMCYQPCIKRGREALLYSILRVSLCLPVACNMDRAVWLEGGKQAVKIGRGPAGPLYTEQAHCQRVYYNGEIAVIRPILSIHSLRRGDVMADEYDWFGRNTNPLQIESFGG